MRARNVVVILLFMCSAFGFILAQDQPAPDPKQQTEEAVQGIAMFPAVTQTAILKICQKPEIITQMAATKKLPDMQGCSESIQKAAQLLERYPDVIATLSQNIEAVKLVGAFYAQSPDQALALVKKGAAEADKTNSPEEAVKGIAMFPADMQTDILTICQKPDLIAEMAKTKKLPSLDGCSDAIQKAAKALIDHPDILDTLNQNLDTVKVVGDFYAKSPDKALELIKQGSGDAQEGTQAAVEEAVKGIAMFPADTQNAVLEICQKPDLIAEMAKTKQLPNLDGCSDAIQKAAKTLVDHPDIIETLNANLETAKLVGSFYAQSPDKALDLVKQGAAETEKAKPADIDEAIEGIAGYPAETRTAILEICQKPELIAEIAKTKKLPDLQGYSEAVQNAAKELMKDPQIIDVLNENIETAKMLGNFYAQSPAEALAKVNKAADALEKENQSNKEKWANLMKENPKALEEYRNALEAMKKEQAAKAQQGEATTSSLDLHADVVNNDVTIYNAPPPEVVDYVVDNADLYPTIAVQLSLFWNSWPYWHHYSPWYPWHPWPYPVFWPGPVYHPWWGPWHHPYGPWYNPSHHPWGPWYHPWHHPYGPYYHPWHKPLEPWQHTHHPWGPWDHPYGPWHHAHGPGPHPWPHPEPGPQPHPTPHPWPHPTPVVKPGAPLISPLKPAGRPTEPGLHPGSKAPLAYHDLHGLVSPRELEKNPATLGEWSRLQKEFPGANKPLTGDENRVRDLMSRPDQFPNLSRQVNEFGERHPDHELNEWRQNPRPYEGRSTNAFDFDRPQYRSGDRPASFHTENFSRPQHMSYGMDMHRSSWGGMGRGGGHFRR